MATKKATTPKAAGTTARAPRAAAKKMEPVADEQGNMVDPATAVRVFDKNGQWVRTYSLQVQGPEWAEKAEKYAAKISGDTRPYGEDKA